MWKASGVAKRIIVFPVIEWLDLRTRNVGGSSCSNDSYPVSPGPVSVSILLLPPPPPYPQPRHTDRALNSLFLGFSPSTLSLPLIANLLGFQTTGAILQMLIPASCLAFFPVHLWLKYALPITESHAAYGQENLSVVCIEA